MAHEDDLYVAREAVRRGLITRDQLQDALFEMYDQERMTGGERWPLGVVLVSSGAFPEAVLLSLLAERVRSPREQLTSSQEDDLDLGRLLVLTGTLDPEQVNEALAAQQRESIVAGRTKRLGELLVESGIATPEQIQRALSYQRTAVLACNSCGRRFNAMKASPRAALRCPRCGGALARSRTLAFDESIRLQETEAARRRPSAPIPPPAVPVGEQAQIDRALALYVLQKGLVPHDALREAQSLQLEMSRFGIEIALLDVMKRFGILTPRQAAEVQRIDFTTVVHGPDWTKQAIPGYAITRKISVGHHGIIFAAEPLFGGETVAVKVLHPERARDPAAVERFRREADLLVKFDHPAIVRGLETGVVPPLRPGAPELHYLTMEYVDAEPLDHLISVGGALAPRQAVRITAQLAHGLHYLERQGHLHRDVKPENVLVDREGLARLCDLGLAAEAAGASAMSAAYASPEQVRGATDVDGRSGIYSLGLMLHAMLAGRPPFAGATAEEVLQERFGAGRDGSPGTEGLSAPPALLTLLSHMLESDRARRPRDYAGLLEALRQACS